MTINIDMSPIIWRQEDLLCTTEWSVDEKTNIRALPFIYGVLAHITGQALRFHQPDNNVVYIDKEQYYRALLQYANLDPTSETLKKKLDALTFSFLQNGPITLRTKHMPQLAKSIDLSNSLFCEICPPLRKQQWMQKIPVSHPRNVRLVENADDVKRKLNQELDYADDQLSEQKPNPHFSYIPLTREADASPPRPFFLGPYEIGISLAQGARKTMEDRYLVDRFSVPMLNETTYDAQLFAILDGHGGDEAADYVQKNLRKKLQEALSNMASSETLSDVEIWNALKLTFVALDEECKALRLPSGTTATVALIIDGNLWVANVGDSRTILQDLHLGTRQLTEDFHATNERNVNSIKNRGGFIIGGKIPSSCSQGFLSVGRSIGSGTNARPKIVKIPLSEIAEGSFLILGSDGIYGMNHTIASSEQIGEAVEENAAKQTPLPHIAQDIVNSAFQAGSSDNLALMIVRLTTA